MCAIDKIYTTGIRGVCYHREKSVAEGAEYGCLRYHKKMMDKIL